MYKHFILNYTFFNKLVYFTASFSNNVTFGADASFNADSRGLYFYANCGIEKWSGYGPSLVAENGLDFEISDKTNRDNRTAIITASNISSYIGSSSGCLPLTGGILTGVLTTNTYVSVKSFIYFRNYNDDGNAGYVGRGGGSINDIMIQGLDNYVSLSGLGVKLGCAITSADRSINYISFDGSSYVGYGGGNTGNTNIYGGQILFCNQSGGTVKAIINTSGYMGIGTTTPSYMLHVNGNVGGSNFYTSSDRKLKEDIQIIDTQSLERLFNISDKLLKKFTWKQSGKDSYGFIAQELEPYIPEAITKDLDGVKHVSYNVAYAKIIASLVNKIKKQDKIIQKMAKLLNLDLDD